MKTKKIFTALLAGTFVVTTAVSASAFTLTDKSSDGSTEVTANIKTADPGEVSYIITIPDKVDFGTLTVPEENVDSYKFVDFGVEATKLDIDTRQGVSVQVKDSSSADNNFYLTQKDKTSPFTILYDVYCDLVDSSNIGEKTPVNYGDVSEYGYHLCTFVGPNSVGTTQQVTLALNQKALYGQNLNDIAGDYSGTMTFHSSLLTVGA